MRQWNPGTEPRLGWPPAPQLWVWKKQGSLDARTEKPLPIPQANSGPGSILATRMHCPGAPISGPDAACLAPPYASSRRTPSRGHRLHEDWWGPILQAQLLLGPQQPEQNRVTHPSRGIAARDLGPPTEGGQHSPLTAPSRPHGPWARVDPPGTQVPVSRVSHRTSGRWTQDTASQPRRGGTGPRSQTQ